LKNEGLIQRASQKVIFKEERGVPREQFSCSTPVVLTVFFIALWSVICGLSVNRIEEQAVFSPFHCFFPSGISNSMIFHLWIRLSKMTFIWFAAARWQYDWFWK